MTDLQKLLTVVGTTVVVGSGALYISNTPVSFPEIHPSIYNNPKNLPILAIQKVEQSDAINPTYFSFSDSINSNVVSIDAFMYSLSITNLLGTNLAIVQYSEDLKIWSLYPSKEMPLIFTSSNYYSLIHSDKPKMFFRLIH